MSYYLKIVNTVASEDKVEVFFDPYTQCKFEKPGCSRRMLIINNNGVAFFVCKHGREKHGSVQVEMPDQLMDLYFPNGWVRKPASKRQKRNEKDDKEAVPEAIFNYCLDMIEQNGWRRKGTNFYKRLVIQGENGALIETCAWVRAVEAEKIMAEGTDTRDPKTTERGKEIGQMIINCPISQYGKIVKMLDGTIYRKEVPILEVDRTIFSFTNGVYLARENRFIEYKIENSEELKTLNAAAKHFDNKFDLNLCEMKWEDIKPTMFEDTMERNQWTEETKRCLYILAGRLIYNYREMDDWQIAPFLYGPGGYGKSKFALVLTNFYENDDIAALGAVESGWPVQKCVEPNIKWIWWLQDVERNCKLDVVSYNLMIEGRLETVSVKGKSQVTLPGGRFPLPGIICGTEIPTLWEKTNPDATFRRLAMFPFTNVLPPTIRNDQWSNDVIANEMDKILVKCNRAYLDAVKDLEDTSRTSFESKYVSNQMKGGRNSARNETDLINAFFTDEENTLITWKQGRYLPLTILNSAYKYWCDKAKGETKVPLLAKKNIESYLASNRAEFKQKHSITYCIEDIDDSLYFTTDKSKREVKRYTAAAIIGMDIVWTKGFYDYYMGIEGIQVEGIGFSATSVTNQQRNGHWFN